MEWAAAYPQENQPGWEDVRAYISNPLWDALLAYIERAYAIRPTLHYSGCGMRPGWNIKYKKSGKALCTLYPAQGSFVALVVVGAKEMAEAELLMPACTPHVQALFEQAPPYNNSKWLSVDVTSETLLSDVKALMRLRVAPKQ